MSAFQSAWSEPSYYLYCFGSAELFEPCPLPKVVGRFSRPRQRGGDVLGRAVEREGPVSR